jgi:hypothetical protein
MLFSSGVVLPSSRSPPDAVESLPVKVSTVMTAGGVALVFLAPTVAASTVGWVPPVMVLALSL